MNLLNVIKPVDKRAPCLGPKALGAWFDDMTALLKVGAPNGVALRQITNYLQKQPWHRHEDLQRQDGFWSAYFTHAERLLATFEARGFSNFIYGLAKLRIPVPGEIWMNHFWGASQEKLRDFNTQGFSNTLCAVLEIKNEQWIKEAATLVDIYVPLHQLVIQVALRTFCRMAV